MSVQDLYIQKFKITKYFIMRYLKYFLLLLTFKTSGQFKEGFSDFDLSKNPKWQGDTAFFETVITKSNTVLQSNFDKNKSSASIATSNDQIVSTWQFKVNLNFAPSNSNNISIYLLADTIDLEYVKNGYYIKIGKNGSDDGIDFYKTINAEDVLVFKDKVNDLSKGGEVFVQVSRDERANWLLQNFDPSSGNFQTLARFQDESIKTTRSFGFLMHYTSTRTAGFTLDSISLQSAFDFSPPYIVNSKVIDPKVLELHFNEPVHDDSLFKIQNYELNLSVNPLSIRRLALNKIELTFNHNFKIGSNMLNIKYLKDTSNNFTQSTTTLTFQVEDKIPPVLNSIEPLEKNELNLVFSEPIDSLSLAGSQNFKLENQATEVFRYQLNSNKVKLSFTQNLIIRQTYTLIIQKFKDNAGNLNTTAARQHFIFEDKRAPEVVSITHILSYSITLMFSEIIDYQKTKTDLIVNLVDLNYNGTVQKGDGGSIHLIFDQLLPENQILKLEVEKIYDLFDNISSKQTLTFSYDTQKPSLKSYKLIDNQNIRLVFSETLDREKALAHNHYNFTPTVQIQKIDYQQDTISLSLANPLLAEIKYKLVLKNIADKAGNTMTNRTLSLFFDNQAPHLKSYKILFGKLIQLNFSEALNSDSARLLKNYRFRSGRQADELQIRTDRNVNLFYTSGFTDLDTVYLNLSGLVDLHDNQLRDTLVKLALDYPKIQSVHVLDSQHILLWLSEPILQDFDLQNFKIKDKSVLSFEFLDPTRLKLKFQSVVDKVKDTLKTLQISDHKGFISKNLSNDFEIVKRLKKIASKTPQTLELDFTTAIDTNYPNKNLFSLNKNSHPAKVQFFPNLPTKIVLLFEKPIEKNKPQTLWIGNIQFYDDKIQFSDNERFTIDITPPNIQKGMILKDHVVLFLDEIPDLVSSQIINHYVLQDGTLPIKVDLIDKLVYLTYNIDFKSDKTYYLNVKELRDSFNNSIQSQRIKLERRIPILNNHLLVTEIMANPTSNDHLKYEYIELYNNTSDTIELLNLIIKDLSTSASLPNYELAPKTYVILTDSDLAFDHYNNLKINTLGVDKFPNLNNSAESLTLSDEDSNLLDQVNYEDDWYQSSIKKKGGYSLERLNFQSFCHSSSNWAGSQSTLKGSPGQTNTALKHDTSPPNISSIEYPNDRSALLYFDEVVDINRTINVNADGYILKSDHLALSFNAPLTQGNLYPLTIEGIRDCVGNTVILEINLFRSPAPQIGDLIITEIMVDPTPKVALEPVEYLELYNRSPNHIDVSDYQLIVNDRQVNLGHYLLAPQNYLVVTGPEGYTYFKSRARSLKVDNLPTLPNENGFIALKNKKLEYSFTLIYTDKFYKDDTKREGGYSLEMLDLTSFCVAEANWQASEASQGGTPGTINSVNMRIAEPQPIQVLDVFAVSKSSIYIRTDQKLTYQQASLNLNFNADFKVDSLLIDPKKPTLIEARLTKPLQAEKTYQLTLSNLTNCRGKINPESQFFVFQLAQKPNYQDLIFNELLFESKDPIPEFVELYNKTDRYINLQNLKLARVNDEGKRNLKTLLSEPYVLKPNSYLVFTEGKKSLSTAYKIDSQNTIETNLGGFDNTGSRLLLLDSSDHVLDSLYYQRAWHLSFLKEKSNVSLERIDFEAATQDENNWQSAAQSAGFATPTRLNSQAKSIISLANSDCFVVDPIFTPDFDGLNDVMIFRYDCQAQNNILTIRIYKLDGTLIKTLVENYSIGVSGFLKWDGTDDRGQVVALGHYILHISVYNSQGSRTEIRKKVVVGKKF